MKIMFFISGILFTLGTAFVAIGLWNHVVAMLTVGAVPLLFSAMVWIIGDELS